MHHTGVTIGGRILHSGVGVFVAWALIGLAVACAIKANSKRETLPGWPIFWVALLGAFLTFVVAGPKAEVVPPERQYTGPEFCLDERRWDAVIAFTKQFGAARGLRFSGGANQYEGAGLNISLLTGGSEEEIALHVMSNPVERRKAYFDAITREKLTPADMALVKQFEQGLLKFSCS